MPRAGFDRATVIAAASEPADEVGFAGLTMGLPAERVGVRTPSLYKHVDSLDALHRGVGLQAVRVISAVLTRAAVGRSGPGAVRAIAETYRKWALDHPGRYAASVRAPRPVWVQVPHHITEGAGPRSLEYELLPHRRRTYWVSRQDQVQLPKPAFAQCTGWWGRLLGR
ncbi:WHG domain-containing protein [Actinacidiphila glaucinigra]|nr:WHG domain-containing protein [Actinacidiphila glaucinigra]WSD64883.1 WHG domain-containing protein [Actinacidiphila glaucinigra]